MKNDLAKMFALTTLSTVALLIFTPSLSRTPFFDNADAAVFRPGEYLNIGCNVDIFFPEKKEKMDTGETWEVVCRYATIKCHECHKIFLPFSGFGERNSVTLICDRESYHIAKPIHLKTDQSELVKCER